MEHKKRDYTFYLTPETSEKIDAHRILEGKVSRSEFVETAVNFYCGVMDSNENRAFLGDEIIKAMRAIVKDAEGRIFSHFRSQDISLSMLTVLFAANLANKEHFYRFTRSYYELAIRNSSLYCAGDKKEGYFIFETPETKRTIYGSLLQAKWMLSAFGLKKGIQYIKELANSGTYLA